MPPFVVVEGGDLVGPVGVADTGGVVGDGVVAVPEREGVGGGVLQVPVGVVFDDYDVVVDAEGVDGAAAGEREHTAGGVLANRYRVDEVWAFAAGGGPVLEDVEEATGALGAHAFGVDGDGDDVHAAGTGGLDGAHVGVFFDEETFFFADGVAFGGPDVGEGFEGFGKAVCVSAGEDDFWAVRVGDAWMHVVFGEVQEKVIERWIALCLAILQCRLQVDFAENVFGV